MRLTHKALLAVVLTALAAAQPVMAAPPKIDVTLLADHTAVVPGGTIELGVRFDIEDEWHIYWRNRGEGGMPTEVEWRLPEGYRVGPLQWPVPERYVDSADAHTFVLENTPMLLATLEVPKSASPGDKVTIGANVSWLACRKLCVRGQRDVSLTLPIVDNRAKAKPASEALFKSARAAIPEPPGKAKYLRQLSARATTPKIEPGEPFEIIVTVEPTAGHHINAHDPLDEFAYPTDLYPYRTEGVDIGRAVFPKGHVKTLEGLGTKLAIYKDAVQISLPVEPDNEIEADSLKFGGVVTYQACSDKTGQCYPPTSVQWQLTVPVAGGKPAVSGSETSGEQAVSEPEETSETQSDRTSLKPGLTDLMKGNPFAAVGKSQGSTTEQPTGRSEVTTPEATEPDTAEPEATEPQPTGAAEAEPEDQEPAAAVSENQPGGGEPEAAAQGDAAARPKAGVSDTWLQKVQSWFVKRGFAGYLLMGFIGGFLLNLMPCVLPVISIKILSFVRQAGEHRGRIFLLGSMFSLGILTSFLMFGALIMGLLRGLNLGVSEQWGGHFQEPRLVIIMAAIVTAFAMSLFGVFSIFPPKVVNELGGKVRSEGPFSAFAMGLLATALGSACVAPFFSVVIAFAAQQTATRGMVLFGVTGLGMAFPYVLLAAKPGWVRYIPKAGSWMGVFERIMGFALIATVIWLLAPLPSQIGGTGLLLTCVFLLAVVIAVWIYGHVEYGASPGKRFSFYGLALLIVLGGWLVPFRAFSTIGELRADVRERHELVNEARFARAMEQIGQAGQGLDWRDGDIPWVPYTREWAHIVVDAGYTVFIDYTADWCANCKTNEATVINTRRVRETMQSLGVVPFKADYTQYDPEITADLERFNRAGVPMYVILPAERPDQPILLDEIPTIGGVVSGLRAAGPSAGYGSATSLTMGE